MHMKYFWYKPHLCDDNIFLSFFLSFGPVSKVSKLTHYGMV